MLVRLSFYFPNRFQSWKSTFIIHPSLWAWHSIGEVDAHETLFGSFWDTRFGVGDMMLQKPLMGLGKLKEIICTARSMLVDLISWTHKLISPVSRARTLRIYLRIYHTWTYMIKLVESWERICITLETCTKAYETMKKMWVKDRRIDVPCRAPWPIAHGLIETSLNLLWSGGYLPQVTC